LKKITLIVAFVFVVPSAYAGLTGIGIGIHGGIVSGYDNPVLEDSLIQEYPAMDFADNMTNIGMHVDIGTLRIIEFDGSIDYSWKKHEIIQGVDLTFSDISVSGSVKKSFPLAVLKPYAGVGIGIHALVIILKPALL